MELDTQKYIDDMRDLFMSEGWQWIVAECTEMHTQYSDVDSINTADQLAFAKGVRFMASQLLSLPTMIQDLEEEDAEI